MRQEKGFFSAWRQNFATDIIETRATQFPPRQYHVAPNQNLDGAFVQDPHTRRGEGGSAPFDTNYHRA